MNKVWVVEKFTDGKWGPIVRCTLTRQESINGMKILRFVTPRCKFRVVKYEAVV